MDLSRRTPEKRVVVTEIPEEQELSRMRMVRDVRVKD
jgi:hypothetical protein